METVLLCGKGGGDTLTETLVKTLEQYGKVLYAGEQKLQHTDPGFPDFFVREQENLPELCMKSGILVFKTGVRLKRSIRIPEGMRCVLNSRNHQTAELLGRMKIPAAACGMGSRDTLSIASLDFEGAVLSLQRNIFTLQGNLLEPHDFRVKVQGNAGPAQILTISMILLLLGLDSGEGFCIVSGAA